MMVKFTLSESTTVAIGFTTKIKLFRSKMFKDGWHTYKYTVSSPQEMWAQKHDYMILIRFVHAYAIQSQAD